MTYEESDSVFVVAECEVTSTNSQTDSGEALLLSAELENGPPCVDGWAGSPKNASRDINGIQAILHDQAPAGPDGYGPEVPDLAHRISGTSGSRIPVIPGDFGLVSPKSQES